MEAKTALELWNDGMKDPLKIQLYRCNEDGLPLLEGGRTSPEPWFHNWDSSIESRDVVLARQVAFPLPLFDPLNSPTYEELFEQSYYKLFEDLDQELETSRAHNNVPDSPKVECSIMPEPTHLTSLTFEELFDWENYKLFEDLDQEPETSCAHNNVPDSPKGNDYVLSYAALEYSIMPEPTHLTSPIHEELFDQNYQLFEDSHQEHETSRAHNNVPDSPKVECMWLPQPTHLATGIQANPPSIKKAPKKIKRKNHGWTRPRKTRPPQKTVIMVSHNDENGDEVRSGVGGPLGGIAGGKSFQESLQPEQFIGESSSSVHRQTGKQVTPWELPLRTPSPPVFRTPLNAASELAPCFAEHLARCATDWDYPSILFSREGSEPAPFFEEMVPPQTGETSAWPGPVPAQSMTSLAFEQRSSPVLSASNRSLPKRKYASSDDSQSPRLSPSQNPGLENVEPTTKPAPRQKKKRRMVA